MGHARFSVQNFMAVRLTIVEIEQQLSVAEGRAKRVKKHATHALWPAALTCPRCTTTQVGGLWLPTSLWPQGPHQVLRNPQPSNCCGNPPSASLPYRAQMKADTSEWQRYCGYRTASRWHQNPEKHKNYSVFLFDGTGEKHLKCLCQLQVSFAKKRSKGHSASESDSSEWVYI